MSFGDGSSLRLGKCRQCGEERDSDVTQEGKKNTLCLGRGKICKFIKILNTAAGGRRPAGGGGRPSENRC